MTEFVLDAGALIAIERGDPRLRGFISLVEDGELTLTTSSAVVAQVWRGGARQARLAKVLTSDLVVEHALDPEASRRIGVLAATLGTTDVVDGHVALLALDRDASVVTSDPDDIALWGIDDSRIIRC